MLDKYSGWKGSRLTPKKQELVTYDDDTHADTQSPNDDDADVSKRIGIEGATEMLQEGACVMGGGGSRVRKESGVRKDAQVMGEENESVVGGGK